MQFFILNILCVVKENGTDAAAIEIRYARWESRYERKSFEFEEYKIAAWEKVSSSLSVWWQTSVWKGKERWRITGE